MLADIKRITSSDDTADLDMSVESKGGEKYLLPEGNALARLVEYIEYGKQPQEYKGEAKPPCMEVSLGFALYGPGYEKEDGTPRIISTFRMKLSNNGKSRSFKLFQRMNHNGTAKNFAHLLGEPFIVRIVHQQTGKGTFARLDYDNIQYAVDYRGMPIEVPTAPDNVYRVFLWNHPTKEMWDSIYIEKKNFIQETILSAVDYPNSKLEQLLKGSMPSLVAGTTAPVPQPSATATAMYDTDDIPF